MTGRGGVRYSIYFFHMPKHHLVMDIIELITVGFKKMTDKTSYLQMKIKIGFTPPEVDRHWCDNMVCLRRNSIWERNHFRGQV